MSEGVKGKGERRVASRGKPGLGTQDSFLYALEGYSGLDRTRRQMTDDKSVDPKGAKVNRQLTRTYTESPNRTFLAMGNQFQFHGQRGYNG
jgi:hypothetical protein